MALTTTEWPDVTIIIPHRDDPDGLARTLAGISALDRGPLTFEVVVADNASRCGTAVIDAIVAQSTGFDVRLVAAPIIGAGPARNAATAHARGRVLAFIDCDCLPVRGWLTAGVRALAEAPVAGGPVKVVWGGEMNPATAFDLLFGFDVEKSFRRLNHLLTSNLWVRSAVFADVGAFRAGVSEDVEWCHRAAGLGYRLSYVPDIEVHHLALARHTELLARWRRVTAETFLYRREIGRSGVAWAIYCAVVAASVLPHSLRVLSDTRIIGVRMRLLTLMMLARIRLDRAWFGLMLMQKA